MPYSIDDFMKQVQEEVGFLYESYSYKEQSKDSPFAQWSLELLFPNIDSDEAFNLLVSEETWGINAYYQDDESGTFYLISAKYSDNKSTIFGPGVVYSPLDIYQKLDTDDAEMLASSPALTRAYQARKDGYSISLIIVLLGHLDKTVHIEQLRNRYNLDEEQFLYLDVEALRRRYAGLELESETETISMAFQDYAQFSGPVEAIVGVVTGYELQKAISSIVPQIYDVNLRAPLGTTKVNKQMRDTLASKNRGFFWYFNNGITMLCKGFSLTNQDPKILRIESPRIVNGAQTTDTLLSASLSNDDQVSVTIRLIAARPGSKQVAEPVLRQSGLLEDLYLDIARYTNSQNAIEVPDFRSTETVQKQLRIKFAELGWFYEHRRGVKPLGNGNHKGKIKMVDLAQRWFSFDGYPATAIRQKQTLFEEQGHYGNIFMLSRSAEEYLIAFLLFEQIQKRLTEKIKKAKEDVKLAVESSARVPLTAKNYLMIGRATKLAIAHMTALVGKSLNERFGTLNRDLAKSILPAINNESLVEALYPELEDTLFRLATQLQGEKHKTMHSLLSEKATLDDLYDLFKYVLEREIQKSRDPFSLIQVS